MGSGGASIQSYRDLDTWQEAMALAMMIYELVASLPAGERFGLSQQLKRRDFSRFLSIARGSVAKIETQIELAVRIGLLDPVVAEPIVQRCDKLGRILRGLRKSLANKLAQT